MVNDSESRSSFRGFPLVETQEMGKRYLQSSQGQGNNHTLEKFMEDGVTEEETGTQLRSKLIGVEEEDS